MNCCFSTHELNAPLPHRAKHPYSSGLATFKGASHASSNRVLGVNHIVAKVTEVLERDSEVLLAYLLGSAARDHLLSHSDVDIAVLLEPKSPLPKLGEMQERVAKALGLAEEKVDVVDLASASLSFKQRALAGVRLLDRGGFTTTLIREVNEKLPDVQGIAAASLRELLSRSPLDIDPAVLLARLQKAREEAAFLKARILGVGDVAVADEVLRRAMARSVHEAIESILDACRHVVSAKALGAAETYADFSRILAARGLMKQELSQRIEELAKLRNVLVHPYAEVDYAKLYGEVEQLVSQVMPLFESWIAEILAKRPG